MKYFKYYLCLILLLFCTLFANAQFDTVTYDKEKFLIGTLDEYLGYQRSFIKKGDGFNYQRVDIITQNKLKAALFVDALFRSDYSDIIITNNGASKGIKIYSELLSKKVDAYYDYTLIKAEDSSYIGQLKAEMFDREKDKLSYLLGVCIRYELTQEMIDVFFEVSKTSNFFDTKIKMKKEGEIYAISMPNAAAKAQLCMTLLKDLGCKDEDIEYVHLSDRIPRGHFVFFKPSGKVKKMVDEAERLKEHIEKIDVNEIKFTDNRSRFVKK